MADKLVPLPAAEEARIREGVAKGTLRYLSVLLEHLPAAQILMSELGVATKFGQEPADGEQILLIDRDAS